MIGMQNSMHVCVPTGAQKTQNHDPTNIAAERNRARRNLIDHPLVLSGLV